MKQNKQTFNEIGDKTVFNVPENYFANFKVELNKRLDSIESGRLDVEEYTLKEVEPQRRVLRMDTLKPYLYMAAMVVLLLFSISLVMNLSSKESSSLGLSVESKKKTVTAPPTAEDYLINSLGTYGITEYYLDSQNAE